MSETDVRDMLALPDGRLVLAGATSGLVIWNPQTGAHTSLRGPQWLPDDHVLRIELDQMVNPPTLHVATWAERPPSASCREWRAHCRKGAHEATSNARRKAARMQGGGIGPRHADLAGAQNRPRQPCAPGCMIFRH
jgi:hypothetical protein